MQERLDAADPRRVDHPAALGYDLGCPGVVPGELRGGERIVHERIGAARLLEVEPLGRGSKPGTSPANETEQVGMVERRDLADPVAAGGEARPEVLDPGPDRGDRPDPGDDDAAALAHVSSISGRSRYDTPSLPATRSTA